MPKLPDGCVPVNDLYASIQGEGVHAGLPVSFLRLQGCPVGCPWCDTQETWHLDANDRVDALADALGRNPRWASVDVGLLVDHVLSTLAPNGRLVITGGEPATVDLGPFLDALRVKAREQEMNVAVAVETSGTFAPAWLLQPKLWLTVSPKVGMPGGLEVRREVLARANEVKWPVGRRSDVQTLLAMLGDIAKLSPEKVSLQPLSQSPAATALCVEEAKRHGFRLSLQIHKYLDIP